MEIKELFFDIIYSIDNYIGLHFLDLDDYNTVMDGYDAEDNCNPNGLSTVDVVELIYAQFWLEKANSETRTRIASFASIVPQQYQADSIKFCKEYLADVNGLIEADSSEEMVAQIMQIAGRWHNTGDLHFYGDQPQEIYDMRSSGMTEYFGVSQEELFDEVDKIFDAVKTNAGHIYSKYFNLLHSMA
jgi:hypothetical protein